MKSIKCDNCGGNIQMNPGGSVKFCPYCGAAFKLPETRVDLERVRAEHAETMRAFDSVDKDRENRNYNKMLVGLAIFLGVMLLILIFMWLKPESAEIKQLKMQVEKVQQLINEGDYDTALVEAQSIRVKKDGWFDSNYDRWENQRKDLIKIIEQKKKESP